MASDLLDRAVAQDIYGWIPSAIPGVCAGMAWAAPEDDGSYRIVGCICHNTPRFSNVDRVAMAEFKALCEEENLPWYDVIVPGE